MPIQGWYTYPHPQLCFYSLTLNSKPKILFNDIEFEDKFSLHLKVYMNTKKTNNQDFII